MQSERLRRDWRQVFLLACVSMFDRQVQLRLARAATCTRDFVSAHRPATAAPLLDQAIGVGPGADLARDQVGGRSPALYASGGRIDLLDADAVVVRVRPLGEREAGRGLVAPCSTSPRAGADSGKCTLKTGKRDRRHLSVSSSRQARTEATQAHSDRDRLAHGCRPASAWTTDTCGR